VTKERRLGRGLAALLGEDNEPVSISQAAGFPMALRIHRPDDETQATDADAQYGAGTSAAPVYAAPDEASNKAAHAGSSEAALAKDGDLLLLAVTEIDGNPFQPRRDFSETEIASLAESLKAHDMLQPVLVRRLGNRWQLISGERRLRAAILAGWKQIPARVRQADDRLVAELAIVENLQRKDLNAIEKALSFRRYLEQHRCKQDDLAQRLKIDRSTVANLMRLLELPDVVQTEVQTGKISAGHARALLPLGDDRLQVEFSQRVQREGMSVREIERLVQETVANEDGDPLEALAKTKRRKPSARSGQIGSLEQQLRIKLGTKVDIRVNPRGRGQIIIHFRSNDEFERLARMIHEGGSDITKRYAS
jgi:ParB family chromosome partitioning protein